eukprot:m.26812 g.26812  ORF g.26812 m.26812 type:complete len:411 (+) comp7837_c0_seq1:128-1360(+)
MMDEDGGNISKPTVDQIAINTRDHSRVLEEQISAATQNTAQATVWNVNMAEDDSNVVLAEANMPDDMRDFTIQIDSSQSPSPHDNKKDSLPEFPSDGKEEDGNSSGDEPLPLSPDSEDDDEKDESQPTRRSTALAGFQGNVDLGALSTMMPLIEYPEDEEEEGLIENDNDKENEKKATQNPALEHNASNAFPQLKPIDENTEKEMLKNLGVPSLATWYVGKMARKRFEKLVTSGMVGDFLVRRSGSSDSEILCVNDFGEPANYSILHVDGPLPLLYSHQKFRTLDQVIAFARNNPLKSRTKKLLEIQNPVPVAAWFRGSMERVPCEKMVAKCKSGEFVIRKSSSSSNYTLCVNDEGQYINFTIKAAPSQFTIHDKEFPTLPALVDYLRIHGLRGKRCKNLCLGSAARTKK